MEFQNLLISLNTGVLIPEISIVISLLLICLIDLSFNVKNPFYFTAIATIGFIIAFTSLCLQIGQPEQIAFLGSFRSDLLSISFRLFSVISGFICIFLSTNYIRSSNTPFPEFLIFLLTATLGCMLLAGSNDLLILFVSLETLGFASYLMVAYFKQEISNNEAAVKYLLTGAISSSFFLYGLSWLYGLSGGHLELNYLGASLLNGGISNSLGLWLAFLCILIGIGFKLSLAPFHQWTPDVYQAAPSPVTAFLSVSSKAAGLVITLRLLTVIFPYFFSEWSVTLQLLAIASMLIGNLVAFTQTSLKRLLGYSSIGQAGFLIIGLICGNQNGYSSLLVYIFIYIFMNLGTFASLILFSLKFGSDEIKDYSGLVNKDPILAYCLALSLLSLAGMPPLAGFFGKLYIFLSGWSSGFFFLIFVALFTSVVSIYYTLKFVKLLFISENFSSFSNQLKIISSNSLLTMDWTFSQVDSLRLTIIVCTLLSTFLGLFLNILLTTSHFTVESSSILNTLGWSLKDLYF